ncbi:MAG: laccase domain-containing protein, partial [Gemmatimonadota bacterium]
MASQISERRIVGEPPLYEIPGWRELYGVTAGITGRGNGPGRGFDLGLWSEAPVGEVMGRWRLFKSSIPGFDGWVLSHQMHQTRVQTHDSARGWVTVEGMDGHLTGTDGILLLVTVADC